MRGAGDNPHWESAYLIYVKDLARSLVQQHRKTTHTPQSPGPDVVRTPGRTGREEQKDGKMKLWDWPIARQEPDENAGTPEQRGVQEG